MRTHSSNRECSSKCESATMASLVVVGIGSPVVARRRRLTLGGVVCSLRRRRKLRRRVLVRWQLCAFAVLSRRPTIELLGASEERLGDRCTELLPRLRVVTAPGELESGNREWLGELSSGVRTSQAHRRD